MKHDAVDAYDEMHEDTQKAIQWIVAHYHIKNGVKNNDGSLGEIRMTPKEMRDLLAYMLLSSYREPEEEC